MGGTLCFLNGTPIQLQFSLKCLNIHLFRIYNTNTYTYIWNDFEIAEASIIIAHCLGYGSVLN